MSEIVNPPQIDVRQWCQSAKQLKGQNLLSAYGRLIHETKGQGAENIVDWSVRAESLDVQSGRSQAWLHLEVTVNLPLACQRCLGKVNEHLHIQRSFRFVDSESQAELQDDASEEDLLVMSRHFDLMGLIEDEVLMDLPLVPKHVVCPVPVKLATVDPDFELALVRPNPFSSLAVLKVQSGESD